jgi:NAD(P)-dependent dehydrogenase (short-subunit alcohol dehydrogenase family)
MKPYANVTFDFSGRNVVVTGGSGGIGHGIARRFQATGATVTITGTRASALDYDEDLGDFRYASLEMRDGAAVEAFAAGLDEVDVLVNNAGTAIRMPEGLEPNGFADNIEINLNAVYRLSYALRSRLTESRGSVINIASMTSYFSSPRVPGYGASKAGIMQLTQSLAGAWAEDGIRVNALAPGWITSRMTAPVQGNEGLNATIIGRTPLGRWGVPDEVAGGALFLASEAAGFITGVTLPVDGGFSSCGV